MSLVAWPTTLPDPEKYIPGRLLDQVVHRGFTVLRAPVLTRSALWRQTLVWPHLDHDERQRIDSLVELMHGEGLVARVPWGFYQRRLSGVGSLGSPSVNGLHAAGATTVTSQAWSGASPYIHVGDMVGFEISVGGQSVARIHRLRANVAAGSLDMDLWPPLREALPDQTAIYYMPSTVGGADGRLQSNATTSYLEVCMALAAPEDIEGEAFPSNPVDGHYGTPVSIEFAEVKQNSY